MIDLAPLIEPLLMILGTGLSVVGMWAIRWLGSKNKLLADAEVRRYLDNALLQGLGLGLERTREFAQQRSTVAVRSVIVAEAAQHVITHVPDALRRFNLDEAGVKQMLEARLPLIDPPTSADRIPDAPGQPIAPLTLPSQEG